MKLELPEGYTAWYEHWRHLPTGGYRRSDQTGTTTVDPRGGRTIAHVVNAERNEVAAGLAECHPSDNYDKRIGRLVALGRALKSWQEEIDAKAEAGEPPFDGAVY